MEPGDKKRYPFVDRVLEHWRSRNVKYLPGVSESELRSFERKHKVDLPEELRAFYTATNGVRVPGTDEVDDRNYDFWPLHELRLVENNRSQLYFADFQQWTWPFAIELVGDEHAERGAIYVVSGRLIKIAQSFAEFMDLYIADDSSLYWESWKNK